MTNRPGDLGDGPVPWGARTGGDFRPFRVRVRIRIEDSGFQIEEAQILVLIGLEAIRDGGFPAPTGPNRKAQGNALGT